MLGRYSGHRTILVPSTLAGPLAGVRRPPTANPGDVGTAADSRAHVGPDQPIEEHCVEPWADQLLRGETDRAWDLFVDRYRRLIFSAIRRYTLEHDEVMDVFAHVCAALREANLARLRGFVDGPASRARFSTWLVAVVRNQTIDWFRHRDGRHRLTVPAGLTHAQQRIYERVFHDGRSHLEVFELLTACDAVNLSYREYSRELAVVYRVAYGGRRAPLLRELGPPAPLPALQPDDELAHADAAAKVDDALSTLEETERLAIQLFVVEEMAAVDVANVVGWPNAKAVYNRVTRALAAMRQRLEGRGIHRADL